MPQIPIDSETADLEESISVEGNKAFWLMRKSAEPEEAEVLFYGYISESPWCSEEIGPKQFADDLAALGNISHIKLRINSAGGDLFAANAIYNIIRNHKAKVTAYVDGLAASAATIVLMAGDKIIMPRNAMLMLHNPSTMAIGDAIELRKVADMLDTARETMLATYENRTKVTRTKLLSILNAETWMTAKDAVDQGFADEIDEQLQIAASIHGRNLVVNGLTFDAKEFKHIPETFARLEAAGVTDCPILTVTNSNGEPRFNVWCPFVENGVNESDRMVFGYATIFGEIDSDGHRMTKEAIENALPAYAEYGNVRERHTLSSVGTAPVLQIDEKGLLVGAHISEGAEDAWLKVKDTTYKGFSLGGAITGKTELIIDNRLVYDLTEVIIDEISLCDRPKCSSAVFHLVTNRSGQISHKGGVTNLNGENEEKSLGEKIKAFLTGEGKEDVATALGFDPAVFATTEGLESVKAELSELTSKIDEFIITAKAASDAPSEVATATEDKYADETKQVADAMKSVADTLGSLTSAMESVSERVASIEDSKGVRKSGDADGCESPVKDVWDGVFPKSMSQVNSK